MPGLLCSRDLKPHWVMHSLNMHQDHRFPSLLPEVLHSQPRTCLLPPCVKTLHWGLCLPMSVYRCSAHKQLKNTMRTETESTSTSASHSVYTLRCIASPPESGGRGEGEGHKRDIGVSCLGCQSPSSMAWAERNCANQSKTFASCAANTPVQLTYHLGAILWKCLAGPSDSTVSADCYIPHLRLHAIAHLRFSFYISVECLLLLSLLRFHYSWFKIHVQQGQDSCISCPGPET